MTYSRKERPILFSAPMVRALLAGTKTQTRRVVKWRDLAAGLNLGFSGLSVHQTPAGWVLESPSRTSSEWRCAPTPSPYGVPGDRLWVRETHLNWWKLNPDNPTGPRVFSHVAAFAADGYELEPGERWTPSIHMLRAASRIDLEVTGVRVERLQDISEADAKAEGTPCYVCDGALDGRSEDDCHCFHRKATASDYRNLWEQINGAGSWAANPWVWVVEFRRIP